MSLFQLLGLVVYAAETIISPLPDDQMVYPIITQTKEAAPTNSFSSLYDIAMRESPIFSITPTPTPPPIPAAATKVARKKEFTISIIGDSMVDTLGPDGGGLDTKLRTIYPKSSFTIINHGVGATNIDYGLERLTNGYTYLGESRPSVISQKPDVIVIESFGYNPYPYDEGAISKHWTQLAAMVNTIRTQLPQAKIVIATTIAPNWDVFGDGAPFINMSPEGKKQKVATIKQYLESTVSFARGEHLPLADAFHPSMDSQGNGKIGFINGGDHIHYSGEGRSFMASTIARTISENRLLE